MRSGRRTRKKRSKKRNKSRKYHKKKQRGGLPSNLGEKNVLKLKNSHLEVKAATTVPASCGGTATGYGARACANAFAAVQRQGAAAAAASCPAGCTYTSAKELPKMFSIKELAFNELETKINKEYGDDTVDKPKLYLILYYFDRWKDVGPLDVLHPVIAITNADGISTTNTTYEWGVREGAAGEWVGWMKPKALVYIGEFVDEGSGRKFAEQLKSTDFVGDGIYNLSTNNCQTYVQKTLESLRSNSHFMVALKEGGTHVDLDEELAGGLETYDSTLRGDRREENMLDINVKQDWLLGIAGLLPARWQGG